MPDIHTLDQLQTMQRRYKMVLIITKLLLLIYILYYWFISQLLVPNEIKCHNDVKYTENAEFLSYLLMFTFS